MQLAFHKAEEAGYIVRKYEAAAENGWKEAQDQMAVAGQLDGEAEELYEEAMMAS
ncbi:MAG: hypothetical protein JRN68_01105 [Nitrososphaerota archaeon]|nr:hypothetical protein [Ferrimicrobium acidiphilum]MDG6933274.1 hypothetical protein [Nitrososphaerota archaeon]